MDDKVSKEVSKAKKKDFKRLKSLQKKHLKLCKVGFLVCPVCESTSLDIERLKKHIFQNHIDYPFNETKEYISRIENKLFKVSLNPGNQNAISHSNKKLKIASKRGIKVYENFKCDICRVVYSFGWKYKETNMGEVCICSYCKDKYKKGRLNRNQIIPGSFESST